MQVSEETAPIALENIPVGHDTHLPLGRLYVFIGHEVALRAHDGAPAALYAPAGQRVHEIEPMPLNLPAVQSVQRPLLEPPPVLVDEKP